MAAAGISTHAFGLDHWRVKHAQIIKKDLVAAKWH